MRKLGFKNFMVFFILSATVAIAYQVPYLRYTFYDQMMEALHLNNTQMGVLATAVNLISTLSYPIGGFLADRFSTRKLITITLAAFTVLTVLFALTTNYLLLLIIHGLYGFFGIATLWSAYLNGIRNLGTDDNQSTIFGSSEATRGIVQTLMGFIFLGIIGSIASPAAGVKTMLLVAAAIIGVFFILSLVFLPKEESSRQSDNIAETEKEHYNFVDVLKNPGVWIMIFLIMGAFMTWSLCNGYMTTYTVQVLKISSSMASTLGIIRSYIIVFVAGFLGGVVLDKFTYKGKGMIILLSLIIACILGVMLTSKILPICIVISLIIAFFTNVIKSTYWSTMDQAGIPVKMTPLATGIISFIAFAPDFIVSPICGSWIDKAAASGNVAMGFTKIFIMMITFAVIGIIASILLIRRTKQGEQK